MFRRGPAPVFVSLPSGTVVCRKYVVSGPPLGKGANAICFKATYASSARTTVALKVLRTNADAKSTANFASEADILRMMGKHNNVMRLRRVLTTTDGFGLMVLPYYGGGSLYALLKHSPEGASVRAREWLRQLFSALRHVHAHGVVHCDVKTSNLLLDDSLCTLCLTDFGLASLPRDLSPLTRVCGTAGYVAPEVFGKKYSFAADMWSAGVVAFVIFTNTLPFGRKSEGTLVLPASLAPECKDLCARLICGEAVRLIADQALAHRCVCETGVGAGDADPGIGTGEAVRTDVSTGEAVRTDVSTGEAVRADVGM